MIELLNEDLVIGLLFHLIKIEKFFSQFFEKITVSFNSNSNVIFKTQSKESCEQDNSLIMKRCIN